MSNWICLPRAGTWKQQDGIYYQNMTTKMDEDG